MKGLNNEREEKYNCTNNHLLGNDFIVDNDRHFILIIYNDLKKTSIDWLGNNHISTKRIALPTMKTLLFCKTTRFINKTQGI